MLKVRLIPVLLLQNGFLVRAETFSKYRIIGNPLYEVRRYNEWNVDELIYLDITRDGDYHQPRPDRTDEQHLTDPLQILEAVSRNCFMPLTWGGRIRSVEDMRQRFANGADKITINTMAYRRPELITEAAKAFGSQAVVVSVDARRTGDAGWQVAVDGGTTPVSTGPVEWARRAEELGAGEILLTSIDRDGTGLGYDTDLIHEVAKAVAIPVIACGGAGDYHHYVEAVRAGASAVAAANLFHYKEISDRRGKKVMSEAGIPVRV